MSSLHKVRSILSVGRAELVDFDLRDDLHHDLDSDRPSYLLRPPPGQHVLRHLLMPFYCMIVVAMCYQWVSIRVHCLPPTLGRRLDTFSELPQSSCQGLCLLHIEPGTSGRHAKLSSQVVRHGSRRLRIACKMFNPTPSCPSLSLTCDWIILRCRARQLVNIQALDGRVPEKWPHRRARDQRGSVSANIPVTGWSDRPTQQL